MHLCVHFTISKNQVVLLEFQKSTQRCVCTQICMCGWTAREHRVLETGVLEAGKLGKDLRSCGLFLVCSG